MKCITNKNNITTLRQLARPSQNFTKVMPIVESVLNEVRIKGDVSLIDFAYRFDGAKIKSLLVSETEIKTASSQVSKELKNAILLAKGNIEKFHKQNTFKKSVTETSRGVLCWKENLAINKVGLYIPGGTAPLFSTLLMLGIPAKLAGCEKIVVCTPPQKDGTINPVILYVASLLGIKTIVKSGGAQAVAAMAYGTNSVPKVDKIFGPGNQYVTCAKQLVTNMCAIDMPAGPSELAIIADESCIPEFVAADLLSQAEHGADSQVLLLTNSESVLKEVKKEIEKQLDQLPRKEVAAVSIKNSFLILVENLADAFEIMNEYAPEHLIVTCLNTSKWLKRIRNAGSVFVGNYSCESAGDYASGTNHTLPTSGFAKSFSGVSVSSFQKQISFQKISKKGLQNIGAAIEVMADAEGLEAHKNAVSIRLKSKKI
jgi:histidinol dehydrogenase